MYSTEEVGRLVAWCSLECHWQKVGPLKVSYMMNAYLLLAGWTKLTNERILELGHNIEPHLNPLFGYRQVSVAVGDSVKANWQEVPRLMDQLLEASWTEAALSPTEFFREFEEIHPFRDGNGRVGALLYNWLNTSYSPLQLKLVPNLWNDPNREKEYPKDIWDEFER